MTTAPQAKPHTPTHKITEAATEHGTVFYELHLATDTWRDSPISVHRTIDEARAVLAAAEAQS